jgi:hypothetical protein
MSSLFTHLEIVGRCTIDECGAVRGALCYSVRGRRLRIFGDGDASQVQFHIGTTTRFTRIECSSARPSVQRVHSNYLASDLEVVARGRATLLLPRADFARLYVWTSNQAAVYGWAGATCAATASLAAENASSIQGIALTGFGSVHAVQQARIIVAASAPTTILVTADETATALVGDFLDAAHCDPADCDLGGEWGAVHDTRLND